MCFSVKVFQTFRRYPNISGVPKMSEKSSGDFREWPGKDQEILCISDAFPIISDDASNDGHICPNEVNIFSDVSLSYSYPHV